MHVFVTDLFVVAVTQASVFRSIGRVLSVAAGLILKNSQSKLHLPAGRLATLDPSAFDYREVIHYTAFAGAI